MADTSPTLRQIARAAGVSPMTVSRALRDHPRQSAATRERIRKIAHDLGYRPNPLISALMTDRARRHGPVSTANLAILDPRHSEPKANGPYFLGCVQRAQALGYQIETFPYDPATTSPAYLRSVLIHRGIRGIVLAPVPKAFSHVEFDFTGFAAVTIGYSVASPALPRVANDIQNMMYDAFRYLEDHGYRRVGVVMADDANRRMLCLYSSASTSYHQFFSRGLEIHQRILPDEEFPAAQIRGILAWARKHRLQAILSSAEYLRRNLKDHGAKIPEDFAFLHLHKLPEPEACMDQMRELIGLKCIDVISAMIQRNESYPTAFPQTVLTPAVLQEGISVPDLRPARGR